MTANWTGTNCLFWWGPGTYDTVGSFTGDGIMAVLMRRSARGGPQA